MSSKNAPPSPAAAAPRVTSDPRFRAGRTLVQTGKANEGAIDMFATLLEECRQKYGEASIEAAACYYEYGNALFRGISRAAEEEDDEVKEEEGGKKQSATAAAAAAAAEKRAASGLGSKGTTGENKKRKLENGENIKSETLEEKKMKLDEEGQTTSAPPEKKDTKNDEEEEKDDIQLALEMMENAYSILDEYLNNNNPSSTNTASSSKSSSSSLEYKDWARDQIPRILLGIGDVFSFLNRHADAADAYLRAIPHRESAVECYKSSSPKKEKELSIQHLQTQRHLVEAIVLVAEALLACDGGKDVITTESKVLLVKKEERVEYARGYYDKARDELQEAVYLMGKIAASGQDLGTEKEDVCFLATMLMGVGNTLAEIDEQLEEGNKKIAAKKI